MKWKYRHCVWIFVFVCRWSTVAPEPTPLLQSISESPASTAASWTYIPTQRRICALASYQEFWLAKADTECFVGTSGQDQEQTRNYIIRVVDADSKTVPKDPIPHAKVQVEIGDPLQATKNGYTDARGLFSFTWQPAGINTRAHISVEAKGFDSKEEASTLIEDRIIGLTRTK